MVIQVIIKYLHQLMLTLHLFEWLCNMLFFHACEQENCFVYAFMFDGPKRAATKFDLIG